MKQVIFYFDNEWAFGSIHYELCKYLFAKGINGRVLPWDKPYSNAEMQELETAIDVFVTNPQGYKTLVRSFSINPTKIIVIAHAVVDLHDLISNFGVEEFQKPKKFAVVSEFLKQQVSQMGIIRQPELLPMGINVSTYTSNISNDLKTVGFAGAFSRVDTHLGLDLKRGFLVEQCTQLAGLELSIAQPYHNSFVTMAGFYPSVDCVIIASTEEGAGLPALEAGAAGKLVISTPVGHWEERCGEIGGHTVPFEENKFIQETTKLLEFYKSNPKTYRQKCREIQKHAKTYDWKYVINKWVETMSS